MAILLATRSVPAEELDLALGNLGEEPASLNVIDGEFQLVETPQGIRCIEVSPFPLTEAGALFGPTIKGAGKVSATFIAADQGRRRPRFGIGLHGVSGYRLRVVPARHRIELLHQEERVAEASHKWHSGAACHLELRVFEKPSEKEKRQSDWMIEAFAWQAGQPRPPHPVLTCEMKKASPGRGKASLWATPYAGLPIRITAAAATPGNSEGAMLNPRGE